MTAIHYEMAELTANMGLGEAEKNERVIPRPIVFCGPSGTGKTTMVKYLLSKLEGKFHFVVSHTSREPRNGEIDGVDYHFMSKEYMLKKIESDFFFEYASVHEHLYGTSRNEIEKTLNFGKICLLDVNPQGVKSIKKSTGSLNPLFVLIKPPNSKEQERRIIQRMNCEGFLNKKSENDVQNRLAEARNQLEFYMENEFDAVIVNDDLEEAQATMQSIVTKWYPNLTATV